MDGRRSWGRSPAGLIVRPFLIALVLAGFAPVACAATYTFRLRRR